MKLTPGPAQFTNFKTLLQLGLDLHSGILKFAIFSDKCRLLVCLVPRPSQTLGWNNLS